MFFKNPVFSFFIITVTASSILAQDAFLFMDVSGSMQGQKEKHAKESAKLGVAILDDGFDVQVIAFNDSAKASRIFSMTQESERDAAKKWLDRISIGGGTDYLSALRATTIQKDSLAIWISDGAHNGPPEPVRDFVKKNVRGKLYTIAVECPRNSPAEQLMTDMAVLTGGSFVRVEKSEDLVTTMVEITARVSGNYRSLAPDKDVIQFNAKKGRMLAVGYAGEPKVDVKPATANTARRHHADLPGHDVDLLFVDLGRDSNVTVRLMKKGIPSAHLGEIHVDGFPTAEMNVETEDGRIVAGGDVDVTFAFKEDGQTIDPRKRQDLNAEANIVDASGKVLASAQAKPSKQRANLKATVKVPENVPETVTIAGKTGVQTSGGHEFVATEKRSVAVVKMYHLNCEPSTLRLGGKVGVISGNLQLQVADAAAGPVTYSAVFADKQPEGQRILSTKTAPKGILLQFEATRPGAYRGRLLVRATTTVRVKPLHVPYEFTVKPKHLGLAIPKQRTIDLGTALAASGTLTSLLTFPSHDGEEVLYVVDVEDLGSSNTVLSASADKQRIKPTSSSPATLKLSVDVANVPPGTYLGRITVRNDALGNEYEWITNVKLRVTEALSAEPLSVGKVEIGKIVNRTLKLKNHSSRAIRDVILTPPKAFKHNDEATNDIVVTLPQRIKTLAAGKATSVEARIAISPLLKSTGSYRGEIRVRRGTAPALTVPVRIDVIPTGQGKQPLLVAPTRLNLNSAPGEVVQFKLSVKQASDVRRRHTIKVSAAGFQDQNNRRIPVDLAFKYPDGLEVLPSKPVAIKGFVIAPTKVGALRSTVNVRSDKGSVLSIPIVIDIR